MSAASMANKGWFVGLIAVGCCGVPSPSAADIVHLDDVIVEGSICVSADDLCADGEAFGFVGVADIKINDSVPGIWFADSTSLDWYIGHLPSSDEFSIANNSGLTKFRVFQDAPSELLQLTATGVKINGNLSVTSSREVKERFEPVDVDRLLERVAALPIYEWNFRDDATEARHIGPVAEDFNAAFPLAEASHQHIAVTDMAGVTLAAIQSLVRRLERLEEENLRIAEDNRALSEQLTELLAIHTGR